MDRVDLHVHTLASDGAYSPSEVVREAVAKGLVAIAITDHDTTAGVDEALEAAKGTDLEVVPGIELSAELGSEEVHILGYYLDHHDQALQQKLDVLRRARHDRARKMVERLAALGMPLQWEQVAAIAADSSAFGRPHIAQALQQKGYVDSTGEAFARYIGLGGPAHVSRYKLTPVAAVEIISKAKGLSVLAHPWGQEHVLPELVEAGLVGLEAYYGGYSIEQRETLLQLAHKYNLVATGGSDFHGYAGGISTGVGDVPVPAEWVRRLSMLATNRGHEGSSHH